MIGIKPPATFLEKKMISKTIREIRVLSAAGHRTEERVIFWNDLIGILDRNAFRDPIEITISVEMYFVSNINEGTEAKAFKLRETRANP
jgi:hypothetical protein